MAAPRAGARLYCGVFPEQDENLARSRRPDGPDRPGTHLGWAWAWPAYRRDRPPARRQWRCDFDEAETSKASGGKSR
jgi:hypothetical protein